MVDTSITIKDSGYRQVPTTGSETDKTNSGSAITLKAISLKLDISALINDEATKQFASDDDTKKFDFGEVDKNGINMPIWRVDGILDMDQSSDRIVLANLYDLVLTKGFKIIETTDNAINRIFLRWTHTTPVTSINVRVKSFSAKQKAGRNTVDYTLNFVETN